MSIKMKLISCISAFILVLGIMFGAVLAAEQVQVNIGGSVSFTATSVHAMISGSVSGSTTSNTLPSVTVDAETQDGTLAMGGDWSNMHLDFNEAGDDITVTINIQNLSDRTIYVSVADNTNISNVNVTRQAGTSSIETTDTNRQITANQTLTYTFRLSIVSKDTSVENGSFDIDVNLSSIAQEQHTYNVSITTTGRGTRTFYVFINDEPISFEVGDSGTYEITSDYLLISLTSSPSSIVDVSTGGANVDALGVIYVNDLEVYGFYSYDVGARLNLTDDCEIRLESTNAVAGGGDIAPPGDGGVVVG